MRILHVLRGPIGGLFRHVSDMVRGQSALGHDVGVICDSSTGGTGAEIALAKLLPLCSLGITRLPISVMPNFADVSAIAKTKKLVTELNVDVLHGHGAKGGLYARLAGLLTGKKSVYTPHGGSLHYEWLAFPGVLFMSTEWLLRQCTSGFAFVCDYEKDFFTRKIGVGRAKTNMIHNGLWPEEFKAVDPAKYACDLLFVGELCHRKGVDLLIKAIAELKPTHNLSVALVGDGPDMEEYEKLVADLKLQDNVKFKGRVGIAQALPMGKVFILPSRAESFPYVIVEAIAAHKTTISTRIAGLKEVLPDALLYESESIPALVQKLRDVFDNPQKFEKITLQLSHDAPQNFSAEKMVKSVTDFYTTLS